VELDNLRLRLVQCWVGLLFEGGNRLRRAVLRRWDRIDFGFGSYDALEVRRVEIHGTEWD